MHILAIYNHANRQATQNGISRPTCYPCLMVVSTLLRRIKDHTEYDIGTLSFVIHHALIFAKSVQCGCMMVEA